MYFSVLSELNLSEEAERLPSPVQSPLPFMPLKSIPWIPLQPALTLEDVSMVEAETMAKFREKLVSDDDFIDSSHTSALFSSHCNLSEFEDLALLETKLENGEENFELMTRPQSLPNISVSFAKDVSISDSMLLSFSPSPS